MYLSTIKIFLLISVLEYLCYSSFGNINTFTAIVDLSRSNFSIARTPLFQLKSAM